jgi:hypothetical protein
MLKQLEEILKVQFGREMARRIPSFTMSETGGQELFFLRSGSLVFFVYLSIAESKDAFTLEIASNNFESYPWAEMPGLSTDIGRASEKDIWRFRISKLWGALKEQWWWLGPEPSATSTLASIRTESRAAATDFEQKAAEIEEKIRDAVEKISKYGVPFFKQSAEQHGNSLIIQVLP